MSTIITRHGNVDIVDGSWSAPEPLLRLLDSARRGGEVGAYPWPGFGPVTPDDPWAVHGYLLRMGLGPVEVVDMPEITVGDVVGDEAMTAAGRNQSAAAKKAWETRRRKAEEAKLAQSTNLSLPANGEVRMAETAADVGRYCAAEIADKYRRARVWVEKHPSGTTATPPADLVGEVGLTRTSIEKDIPFTEVRAADGDPDAIDTIVKANTRLEEVMFGKGGDRWSESLIVDAAREEIAVAVGRMRDNERMAAVMDRFPGTVVRVSTGGETLKNDTHVAACHVARSGIRVLIREASQASLWVDRERRSGPIQGEVRPTANLRRVKNPASWTIDPTQDGVLRHEYGHHIESVMTAKQQSNWHKTLVAVGGTGGHISGYGATTPGEAFAETFCLVTHPDFPAIRDTLTDDARILTDFMEEAVGLDDG